MNTDVKVEFIRSDGQMFVADNSDYKITFLDGIDGVKNTIYTQPKAVGDGLEITGQQAVAKDFVLNCSTQNAHLNDIYRRVVVGFFNTKHTYKIYCTYMGVERWCEAQLYELNAPSGNVFKPFEFSATLLRAEAYWKSVDEFAKDIASVEPKWGYPMFDIPNIGTIYDVFNFAKNVEIVNDGDVECYAIAVIEATDKVVNPVLFKNDKFVKILDTMKAGDVYVVDFIKAKLYKNGENVIKLIDKQSNFTEMQFDVGTNVISFDADLGDNVMKVTFYFNKLFGGF